MSNRKPNLEVDVNTLCQLATDLGADGAAAIPATDIVVDERALLKCLVPLCLHYGIDLTCPPQVLPPAQFQRIISRYHQAILIRLAIPPVDPVSSGGPVSKLGEPAVKQAIDSSARRLLEIVARVESSCLSRGYRFAAGFIGGACPLCEQCVGVQSGLPCRYPFQARPSMEAMGIDVIATAEKAGMKLDFEPDKDRSWIGLVLVD